jgi:hypothetical protein
VKRPDEWFMGEVAALRAEVEQLHEAADETLKEEIQFIARWFAMVETLAQRPNGRWVHSSLSSMRAHVGAFAEGNLLTLSPSLAALLLSRTKMRPPTATHLVTIEKFAQTMSAGSWRDGGFITITSDGRLRDGCHRCHAVIASQTTIRVFVLCRDPGL